jgi:hypothetical protein
MHTQILLQQIEKLLASHEAKLTIWSVPLPTSAAAGKAAKTASTNSTKSAKLAKPIAKKSAAPRSAGKSAVKKSAAKQVAKAARR